MQTSPNLQATSLVAISFLNNATGSDVNWELRNVRNLPSSGTTQVYSLKASLLPQNRAKMEQAFNDIGISRHLEFVYSGEKITELQIPTHHITTPVIESYNNADIAKKTAFKDTLSQHLVYQLQH